MDEKYLLPRQLCPLSKLNQLRIYYSTKSIDWCILWIGRLHSCIMDHIYQLTVPINYIQNVAKKQFDRTLQTKSWPCLDSTRCTGISFLTYCYLLHAICIPHVSLYWHYDITLFGNRWVVCSWMDRFLCKVPRDILIKTIFTSWWRSFSQQSGYPSATQWSFSWVEATSHQQIRLLRSTLKKTKNTV